MAQQKDLKDEIFGTLTVLKFAGVDKGRACWVCRCSCRAIKIVRADNLLSGHVLSCRMCVSNSTFDELRDVLKQRILKKIKVTDTGCWEWQGALHDFGYGSIRYQNKTTSVHTLAYRLFVGEIDSLCVLHQCDNPPCCNPDHLFLGTKKNNTDDMLAKGRHVSLKGEFSGMSKLTQEKANKIRSIYLSGAMSSREIGDLFHIHHSTVLKIAHNRSWVT